MSTPGAIGISDSVLKVINDYWTAAIAAATPSPDNHRFEDAASRAREHIPLLLAEIIRLRAGIANRNRLLAFMVLTMGGHVRIDIHRLEGLHPDTEIKEWEDAGMYHIQVKTVEAPKEGGRA